MVNKRVLGATTALLFMTASFLAGYTVIVPWAVSWDSPAVHIRTMEVYNGKLYAGASDGIFYMFDGTSWSQVYDSPEEMITSMAVYNGKLYAGTWSTPGKIYNYDGATWGTPEDFTTTWSIQSLAVYNGKLYAGSCPTSGGNGQVFAFDGTTWTGSVNTGDNCIYDLAVYNGKLYGGTGSGGTIIMFDGSAWYNLTTLSENYIFSLAVYNGKLYAGTSDGKIFSYDGTTWSEVFDSPTEDEISGLGVYNGKLFAGTHANGIIYVYDGTAWGVSFDSSESYIQCLTAYNGKLYAGSGIHGIFYVYEEKKAQNVQEKVQRSSIGPLAQTNILKAANLLTQADDLLSQVKAKSLDTASCEVLLEQAKKLLEEAKMRKASPETANYFAIKALEKFRQAIDCLKALLG